MTERSRTLYGRALDLMPGGVNSPVRAFRAVGGDPLFVREARGSRIFDVDGNGYVDFCGSWGALILGHADPEVVAAVQAAAALGTTYGSPHEGEVLLVELARERMPWIDQLRLVSSGTEAAMSAVRLARAATGRPKILKFEGCYHGHADHLLAKAGSGVATFGLPDSAGVPPEFAALTLTAPFNDLDAVSRLFSANPEQVAAILVEPIAGNTGVIPPETGFLEGLREIASARGALLVFDEVITGFRVAPGGAAERYGVEPDLVCLGKILGGGLPLAAYGGRRDLMALVAPMGPVYQAGTLSGNPVAVAAGLATLRQLTPAVYDRLERLGSMLEAGLVEAGHRGDATLRVNRAGSMLSVFLTDGPVRNAACAARTDRDRFARVFRAMLARGFYLPPSALEAWFLTASHTEGEIDAACNAFAAAL